MDTSVTAFIKLMIYIGAIFSILKIIKEFQLDLMLERVDSFHTLGVQKY